MKKVLATGLAAAMALSLGTAALAADEPSLIAAADTGYAASITVNGEALDLTGIPAGEGIPMRAFVEADGGSATWFPEENSGSFYLEGSNLSVDFATGTITVEQDMIFEGAVVVDGVTFVPAEAVEAMSGVTVAESENGWEITTPSSDPMVKLAREIMEVSGIGMGMKGDPVNFEEYYGIDPTNFTQVVGYFPMMTSPDTIIIGQMVEGKEQAIREDLEAYRQNQENTFSWYLTQNLPKVENAQVVVEGEYILFLIAEDAQAGVEAFQAGVETLAQ